MKVVRKPSVIPFGPVGHPRARLFPEFESKSSTAAAEALKLSIARRVVGGEHLLAFYNPKVSPQGNGFHLLDVADDHVSDAELAVLPNCRAYTPASADEPGRQLHEFVDWLPRQYRHARLHHLVAAPRQVFDETCAHDFGLEQSEEVLIAGASGEIFKEAAYSSLTFPHAGAMYLTTTCSRCGEVHGVLAHKP